jgi:hypothetical protein
VVSARFRFIVSGDVFGRLETIEKGPFCWVFDSRKQSRTSGFIGFLA